ncbi:MAG: hypothetical protein WEB04_09200 [Dehalococcoidia bacterium]
MGKPLLAVAIERRAWDLAALCLLAGLLDATSRLPPETLDELLQLLEVTGHDGPRRRPH